MILKSSDTAQQTNKKTERKKAHQPNKSTLQDKAVHEFKHILAMNICLRFSAWSSVGDDPLASSGPAIFGNLETLVSPSTIRRTAKTTPKVLRKRFLESQ
jgi:hypothetical protein